MHVPRRYGAVAITVIAAFVASGCGESVEDAEQALCADLASLRSNVHTLVTIDRDSTVEEFEQARQNVRDSWRDVKASADNLGNDRFDEVEDAWDDFDDTLGDVDDDDSLEDAYDELSEAADEVADAQGEIASGIDCRESASSDHDSMMMEDES